MCGGVHDFQVVVDEVEVGEYFFYFVPFEEAACFDVDMNVFRFYEGQELVYELVLHGGFAAGEGDTAAGVDEEVGIFFYFV